MNLYRVEKSNFKVHFEYKGIDENGDDIMQKYVTYTGEKIHVLYTDPQQHIKDNQAVPEWKCKLLSVHQAVKGKVKGRPHSCMFTGETVTLID